MFLKLLTSSTCAFTALCVYWYWQGVKKVNYIPGHRLAFSPTTLVGALLPTTWWNLGYSWPWIYRESSFFNFSYDIMSIVPVLIGTPTLYSCSVDVLKQLLGNENKLHLVKPLDITLHRLWGESLAASSGEIWRRHRRAVAPAFHSKIFETEGQEAINVFREMVAAEKWNETDEVVIPSIKDTIFKFTLLMIGRCGFGVPMAWYDENNQQDQQSFEYCARVAANTLMFRVVLPPWAFKLPIKRLRDIDRAWSHFTNYTKEYIRDTRLAVNSQKDSDGSGYIIRRLIEASREDAGKYTLTEDEVLADMFTMMFAGHETTASVLSATLGYLSIYQEEQDKAYREVMDHISRTGSVGDRGDSELFPHLSACFTEAGRLFPAALILARTFPEDTPVKVKRPVEETVILPKGSRIIFDLVGIFRNPNVYKDPSRFIPSRWYGVPEADIPMFGTGPRACVGRKFAYTEVMLFLAYLLKDWKLDPVLHEGETRLEYESRIMGMAGREGTAFSVGPVPLKLIRRKGGQE